MMIFFFPFLSTELLWEMADSPSPRHVSFLYICCSESLCVRYPFFPPLARSLKSFRITITLLSFFLCAWADENGNSDRAPQVDVFPWHKPSKGVVCWAWTGEGTSAAYFKCLSFVSNTWHPDIHCSLARCEKLW